jgi:hypothetical protein
VLGSRPTGRSLLLLHCTKRCTNRAIRRLLRRRGGFSSSPPEVASSYTTKKDLINYVFFTDFADFFRFTVFSSDTSARESTLSLLCSFPFCLK